MRITRDSALWWVLLGAGVAGFGSSHFQLITQAFPDLPMIWQSRFELASVLLIFIAGYLRMSPLKLSAGSELAGQAADPSQSLTITGKQKD